MTEGTKSYLFGCHQFFMHPFQVIRAWRKLYGKYPKLWQLVCIFLHDIGHLGKDYLSDYEQKKSHWKMGAKIAHRLFGHKGLIFISGHTTQSSRGMSGYRSKLFWADKYSWLIAPRWWLKLNDRVEGFNKDRNLDDWLKNIRANWLLGCPFGSHHFYLKYKEK